MYTNVWVLLSFSAADSMSKCNVYICFTYTQLTQQVEGMLQ